MDQLVRVESGTDGTLDIALRGEIDFTNSASAADAVQHAVTQGRPPAIRVDIAAVTFLDSSGIGVLIVAYKAAVAIGATYQVVGPRRAVYEQLRLTGLTDLFGIDPPAVKVP